MGRHRVGYLANLAFRGQQHGVLEGDLSGTRGFGPRTGLGKTQPGDGEISGNIIEVWLLEPVSTAHNKSAGGSRPTATAEGRLGVKGTAALCNSPEMKPNDALLRPLLAYADGWVGRNMLNNSDSILYCVTHYAFPRQFSNTRAYGSIYARGTGSQSPESLLCADVLPPAIQPADPDGTLWFLGQ